MCVFHVSTGTREYMESISFTCLLVIKLLSRVVLDIIADNQFRYLMSCVDKEATGEETEGKLGNVGLTFVFFMFFLPLHLGIT
jgi:hypothetical protein